MSYQLNPIAVLFLALLVLAFAGTPLQAQPATQSKPAAKTAAQSSANNKNLTKGILLSPKAFRAAAKKVEPALVTIESFGGVSTVAGKIGGIRTQGEGNTTGVVISPDGYVVTSSFNFIQQPPVITVITSDGERRIAKLLGRDDTRRICLLKIDGAKDLPVPEMIPRKDIKVGQWAISVGVGYGDTDPAISQGIISATNRAGGRAVQTDANISPANYGGPLIDIRGRVFGICVPLNPRAASSGAGVEWYDSGIGFAIPLHGLDDIIDQLKAGKKISPAFLGIQGEFSVVNVGVKIKTVTGPAKKAGIKKSDVIVAINDKQIRDMTDLRMALSRNVAGDQISVTVRRKEEEQKIDVTLGKPPGSEKKKLEPFKR
jgi:serine protease Do